MADYQYRFFNVLNGQYIGDLEISGVAFNRPVKGTGSLSGTVVVDTKNVELVRSCLDFKLAILVVYKDGYPYWPGFLMKRNWNSISSTIGIEVAKARSILNTAFLRPQLNWSSGVLTITDVGYSWSEIEQQRIAREIVGYATNVAGMPYIFRDDNTSPILRDFHTTGTGFKYAAEVIDTMSNRAEGFDWDIEVRNKTVGEGVELYLATWYPERSTGANNVFFEYDEQGDGNIIDYGDVEESAENKATRVWTTGEGTPPSQPIAVDEDPDIAAGYQILREKMTNYSTVVFTTTLASHARAERALLAVPVDLLNLRIKPELLSLLFEPGDRARVKIKDLWLDIDLPNARIVDVSIAPFARGQGEAVGVSIDMSDLTLPVEETEDEEVL